MRSRPASTRCRGSTLADEAGASPRARRRDDLLDRAADARPAAARPVRDRACRRTARAGPSRRSSPSCGTTPTGPTAGRAGRGLPGPVLRRDARDDGRRRAPAARGDRADRGRTSAGTSTTCGPRSRTRRAGWPRRSPTTARPSARSTSRSTTSSASAWACRSATCWASTARIPPTDFTLGIDEPGGRRRARPPGGATSRRSRSRSAGRPTSRRSRRCAACSAARSGSTPTPAGRPTEAAALLPELAAAGRGAHRAAVPGPPARRAARRSRRDRRCRSSPTRAP